MTCPMCRAHFDKLYIPMIDKDLQLEIAEKMGHLFEERKAELEQAGEWLGLKQLLKFSYGNTHEIVKNPKPARSNPKKKNSHRWCMFISINNSPEETTKYIKQVTYHLDPTFKPSRITVKEAPFLLSRVGYGTFDIEMDITFQPLTGLRTKRLEHEISFDGDGKNAAIFLEVDQAKNAKGSSTVAIAKSLAAQLDRLNGDREEEKKHN